MRLLRLILIFLLLRMSLEAVAQSEKELYLKLVKRYGYAVAWGNGYIVKAGDLYGFFDRMGRMVLPIDKHRFDILLNDRASIDNHLIDASGKFLGPERCTYVLINAKRRLLAQLWGRHQANLCTDNGVTITGFDARQALDSRVLIRRGDINSGFSGVISISGDTILPPVYQSVSMSPKIIAGLRNDTAFIYDYDGRLLCHYATVHGCSVLANNLIVLEKYKTFALANSGGRLLSGFRYKSIRDFRYSKSTLTTEYTGDGEMIKPAICTAYVNVNGNEEYIAGGLLDTTGKVILPDIYSHVEMNSNGWMLLKKAGHDVGELVDNKLNTVLKAANNYNPYETMSTIRFLDERFVAIPPYCYPGSKPKVYDMVLKKFTEPPEKKAPNVVPYSQQTKVKESSRPVWHVNQSPKNSSPPTKTRYTDVFALPNDSSNVINSAGTMALRRNSRWGIVSVTGDTILPFVFDTIMIHGWLRHYLASLDDKWAILDWEGNLATPFMFVWPPKAIYGDTIAVTQDGTSYKFKNGRVSEVQQLPGEFTPFINGLTFTRGSAKHKRGIYNRKLKLLGQCTYPDEHSYTGEINSAGLVAICDSLREHVTVIDSVGKPLIPWLSLKNNQFCLLTRYAVSLSASSKKDVIYYYEQGRMRTDTIELDPKSMFNGALGRVLLGRGTYPWGFKKHGYGMGIGGWENVVLIKDAEEIIIYPAVAKVKVKGKWGLSDNTGLMVLPAEYDSIHPLLGMNNYNPNGTHFAFYKNGKVMAYDHERRRTVAVANKDTIYYEQLENRFFVDELENGLANIVRDDGKVIAKGWQNLKNKRQSTLYGITATREGLTYRLYATLSDSLEAVPVIATVGMKTLRILRDGAVIVMKDSLCGVFDPVENRWRIPKRYARIEVEDYTGHFLCYANNTPGFVMYDIEGTVRFSMAGFYSKAEWAFYNQWYLNGRGKAPVVNCRGKIIVPQTYEVVEAEWLPGLFIYKAFNKKNGKWVMFDTTGKMLDPAIVTDSQYEELHNGYIKVKRGGKLGLVRADWNGKFLSPCLYESIQVCTPGGPVNTWDFELVVYQNQDYNGEEAYFIVSLGKPGNLKYGVMDGNGKMLIPCMYDSICPILNKKCVVVKKGKNWGMVTINNKAVSKFIYGEVRESYYYNGLRPGGV